MFSRVALFITAALAVCAIANPAPADEPAGKCDISTDPFLCCKSLAEPSTTEGSRLLKLVGVSPKTVTGKVGSECNPITISAQSLGSGSPGSGCSDTTACCKKYFPKEQVGVDCTPFKNGAL